METPMSAARVCLFAAAILGLNACRNGGDVPPPTPPPTPTVSATPRAEIKVVPRVVRAPQHAAAAVASLKLDLTGLEKQLKETKAIGIFSKIALKNQVDDLMDKFREYYKGQAKFTMAELHGSFNLLMMKVLSMLQDKDQMLASAVVNSRDAIWDMLADPRKFAALQL
jgi:hypothetical protein